jgi:hypothetical protein
MHGNNLCALSHLISIMAPGVSIFFDAHFADEKTEVQKG